ncbi:MAG: 3-phosphoserine/phosphohydroxythreonine transaminase [Bacteroidales bacterium]|nr:3-phosphoserine/phosphohydroxythreonine transaminase [Bacteroidales bacterium]
MRKHNFNPGPSVLPEYTLEQTSKAVLDLNGIGMSILEISHRSKEFEGILSETQELFKELLDIPSGYTILFLGGGASLQFAMIPYNFLNTKAAYLNSGAWASKAMKEAKFFGEVIEVASSKADNYTYIPKNYTVPDDVDYFHITTNNTIYGTELKTDPTVKVPLFADASSDILSRPMDVSKYGIIYGGAQKNLGPAGVAFVIIKNDLLGNIKRSIPAMLDYRTHVENNSLYNTPPVFAIFACLQTLKWLKSLGGVQAIYKKNVEKAQILYDEIDRNKLFRCPVRDVEDRSLMNVCFVMNDEYKDLEAPFLEFAKSKGIVGIKGHRSVGGFRASIYNALPKESVITLVEAMKEFEAKN